MFFDFNILGLLIVFMLMILYHYKGVKERYPFNLILWFSYILQLLYVITDVGIEKNNYMVFGKLYFVCLVLLMVLFSIYNLVLIVKDKYKFNGNKENRVIKRINRIGIVLGVVLSFLIIRSNFWLSDGSLVFGNNIVNIIMWGFVVFNYLVVIFSRCYKLLGFNALLFLMMMVNSCYSDIGIVNSFMVFIPLVMYLVYENYDRRELEVVKLERDYANRNIIDKYAFLKNLSYEIRGPINTIDGLSQVVIDSSDEGNNMEDLKDIRMASRELIDIVNGMIDLSIIESGSLEIILDNYNVYDMFSNINNIILSKLRDKDVSFKCNVSKDIPCVLLGDSERISQVILNLLGNAIKYTNSGKISLDVSSVKNDKVVRLIIRISDTGCGIKKEDLSGLFEQKTDNSIGLVLANHLVSLMNGRIEVESEVGKGTTFVVSFDQKIIALRDEGKEKDIKPFKATGKRVLVVDDNKSNLKVINKMLSCYDVTVVEASSGYDCLDILDKDVDFDLILMDDMMPKLSGTETLSIIKKVSRIDGYYIPIVVLTANVMVGIREKYLGAGFDDYLAKPIEKQELARVLRKYLKGRKKKNS